MVDVALLPNGWYWTTLGEAFKWSSGGTPLRSKPEYYDGEIPWVIIGDLDDGIVNDTQSTITPEGLANSSAKWVEKGSILLAMYGSIGKLGIAGKKLTTNQAIAFTKPETTSTKYLFYYLLGQRQNLLNLGMGATQQNISQTIIKAYPFPVAPESEQERIVARIEELFSQLDAGTAALKRAQVQLNRYKASVLKAAVEGKLVPQDPNDEPAVEVLHMFGKSSLNRKDLPTLPIGWCWTVLETLASEKKYSIKAGPFGSSLKKEFYTPTGYKVYGQEQVIRGDAFFGDYYIDEKRFQLLRSNEVMPGDVLVSLVGTIGRVLILPESIEPGIINPRLVKFSFDDRIFDSGYFKHFMESSTARRQFSTVSHGQTMEVLNLGVLRKLCIPLPPLEEQKRIACEIERQASIISELQGSIHSEEKRSLTVRHSILKTAFEGKLV